MTKHLYLHIPFCHQICKFCDFRREKTDDITKMTNYVNQIIKEIKLTSQKKQYKTIYLGGGTPNYLPNNLLEKLLNALNPYLEDNYELTIECNPDLVTIKQAELFKRCKVNRISLGVQSTNDDILKAMNRTHNINDVHIAIANLRRYSINNISCDFIYNLPNEKIEDIYNIFKFIENENIKHVSIYALEIKYGSILNIEKHKINSEIEDEKFLIIKKMMKNLKFQRYEISNWQKDNSFSKHNLCYWNNKCWKALGYGACGFENKHYYEIGGTINNHYVTKLEKLNLFDYYFQIMMMGLRLVNGIDLRIKDNFYAFKYFENKLINKTKIVNNHLRAKNIDLLDDILIDLIN